ncbi:hypothetical protein pb186bvf_016125 [Paramecium bursaria]
MNYILEKLDNLITSKQLLIIQKFFMSAISKFELQQQIKRLGMKGQESGRSNLNIDDLIIMYKARKQNKFAPKYAEILRIFDRRPTLPRRPLLENFEPYLKLRTDESDQKSDILQSRYSHNIQTRIDIDKLIKDTSPIKLTHRNNEKLQESNKRNYENFKTFQESNKKTEENVIVIQHLAHFGQFQEEEEVKQRNAQPLCDVLDKLLSLQQNIALLTILKFVRNKKYKQGATQLKNIISEQLRINFQYLKQHRQRKKKSVHFSMDKENSNFNQPMNVSIIIYKFEEYLKRQQR